PYIDAITGKIVITVASPLLSDNGDVLGVCGLDIEVTELVSLSQKLKVDANGYAVLVDASGNIVAHSKNSDYSHRLQGQEEVVTRLIDIDPIYSDVLAASGSTNVVSGKGYDGTMRYFPVVPIGDTGWKVLYAADYSEAMSGLNNIIIFAAVASILSAIGGALFFYIKFTKRLRPLSAIESIVTNMSNGVLEHKYPEAVNDEIGTIFDALAKTNKALKSYINEMERVLANMEEGNFVYDSTVRFAGEFTAMEKSIKGICEAMHSTFEQLSSVSEQIAGGSHSVSTGATELANAVSDETRLIGEVHKNLEDINMRISQSAQNASEVREKAVKATDTVNGGNEKMQELLKIMKSISHYASEIVNMNSTIEDIAMQTNILALNASVEASRAGAAGKGFAVVAEEVRTLAAKSGKASKSTAELIEHTVQTIKTGTKAANETAKMLSEVVHETSSISESVSEIADVSEKQKTMLAEIVTKLGEVEAVVGTTSATAQNAAAASEELDGQVVVLKNNLERYI
ncbi:MAG: methyl-accepting chemotaxis protein, partial [Oscillospiraceae bacterium]|nr:methyl-accepting chemotaxis protein [Oscillospiraceae bacterium]